MSPGSLVHTGEQKMEKAAISIINYDPESLVENELSAIEETYPYRDSDPVTWININGLHDVEIIGKIGQHFDVHPLTLEDVVNTAQRPKAEDFGTCRNPCQRPAAPCRKWSTAPRHHALWQ